MILVAKSFPARTFNSSGHCSLFFVGLLSCLLIACAPANKAQSLTFSGPLMGTDFRITVVLPTGMESDLLFERIKATMQALEQSMSTYIDDSEVSQFNAARAGQEFEISDEVAEVLAEALSIAVLSDGYFDVTVGQLVNAWGFGPRGQIEKQPAPEQLLALQQSVGYQKLQLNDRYLSKDHDGVMIDLSAIAKGYTVDRVAAYLLRQGISNFLVDIGGELRAAGRNIDGQLWRVGIERPEVLGGVDRIVVLDNMAIATSGDYRSFLLIDGEKFSHTIDPTTMRPALHQLALVSVISDRASTADALATAMMAMGEDKAQQFAQQNQLAAYFVIRDAASGGYKTIITPQFLPNLQ